MNGNLDQEIGFGRQLNFAKRAEMRVAKKLGAGDDNENLTEGLTGLASLTSSVQQTTSKLLQNAWRGLIATYGLSLLWINAHVFLSKVFGEKFFCKLGMEWLPKSAVKSVEKIPALKKIGLLEVIVLGFLDFIVLVGIFLLVALIALAVEYISKPWKIFFD